MSSMDPLQSLSGSADRVLPYETNQSKLVRDFHIVHCTNIKGSLFVSLSVNIARIANAVQVTV